MGYPVVTRLGRNQFWYRKWYADYSYNMLVKATKLFETLLEFYFRYGIHNNLEFFYNNYWYKGVLGCKKNLNLNLNTNLDLYFRRFFYSHNTLTIEHSYMLRFETLEYFPLRLYIIKYLNWYILSTQWYKPFKTSKNKKIKLKYINIYSTRNILRKGSSVNTSPNKRLKSLYYTVYYSLKYAGLDYNF